MKTRSMLVLLMISTAAVFAQDASKPAPVDVAGEPAHHLKIENEYVRAYFVEVAPGQSTLMHHHATDYVAVAIGAAEIDGVGADGTAKHIVFQDGQVITRPRV